MDPVAPEAFAHAVLGPRLDELVQAMLDHAVPPLFLDNPHPRPLQVLYDAAFETLQEAFSALNDDERDPLQSAMPWHLDAPLPAAILQMATRAPYYDMPETLFDAAVDPDSRVFSALPALGRLVDEDGLVDCTSLTTTDQAIFHGGHALHYHQLLRRHFTSHINASLLGVLLESAAAGDDNYLRLAIDDRRLQAQDEFSNYVEKDYWYGPHLTEAWIDDPYSVGRIVHEDPAGQDSLDGYTRFTALWHNAEPGRKVVQMEELLTPVRMDAIATSYRQHCPYVLLRYLHAIRDIDSSLFVHCDGAVRAYDCASYAGRINEDLPAPTPAVRYRKVFRLDGRSRPTPGATSSRDGSATISSPRSTSGRCLPRSHDRIRCPRPAGWVVIRSSCWTDPRRSRYIGRSSTSRKRQR